jgi:transcriptional regulator EpsA
MALFLPFLSPEEFHLYHRTIAHAVKVRSHFDALEWLQGDMQRYLPHDILIAAWGDFDAGYVQHDIISAMEGVRSHNSDLSAVTPLLMRLFKLWAESARDPITLSVDIDGAFMLDGDSLSCHLGDALKGMRCAMAHGIADKRGSHDCIYIIFSTQEQYSSKERGAMSVIVPYMDTALRQITLLPQQAFTPSANGNGNGHGNGNGNGNASQADNGEGNAIDPDHDLTGREVEILRWVRAGKTNPEIGSILDISEFTVKNHLQRVFKKLDVYNRAQAVGKFNRRVGNA